jgi:hypothetical protein
MRNTATGCNGRSNALASPLGLPQHPDEHRSQLPVLLNCVSVELASPRMYSTLPSDIRRSTLRLAVAAVIVGLAIPLLPVFGEGNLGPFIFSQGLPVRFLIVYLLRYWASAVVAMVGIWFLKRDRAGPAGGVFLALGLVVAIGTAGDILVTAPDFGRWQTDLILALGTVEAILLTLAGSRAIAGVSEVRTGESPPPESRSVIDE